MATLAQRLELLEQIGLAAAEGDAELAGELAAESNALQEQQAEIALALGLELCFQPDAELPDPPAPQGAEEQAAPAESTQAGEPLVLRRPKLVITYRDFTGYSEVCYRVSTDPPQPGAVYRVTMKPPSTTQGGTLSRRGRASGKLRITRYDSYTLTVEADGDDGKTRRARKTVEVTREKGRCATG